MKNLKRTQQTITPTQQSLALLAALPARFTATVNYTTSSARPKSRRLVEVRSNVLLIFKRGSQAAPSDLSHVDKAVVLDSTLTLTAQSPTCIHVDKHRLHLASPALTSALHTLLQSTIAAPADTYTLLGEIGRGGSGVVQLATRARDGRALALKSVPKYDAFASDSQLSHLVAERVALEALAARSSAFVVRLTDAFETDRHLHFVTELGELGDLHGILTRLPDRRLPETAAKRLFAEMLLGLEDVHRAGFLYRDMKAGNVVVSSAGHARLADLGLARRMRTEVETSCVSSDSEGEEEEEVRLVGRADSFVGTRRYMAPEMYAGRKGAGYGAAADVWALGVTLFVMLTGRYPLGGEDADDRGILLAVRNDDVRYPTGLSREAVDLLKGMLEKDGLERLDLTGVRTHAWLREVEWGRIREEARRETPAEEVLAVVGEADVGKVADRVRKGETEVSMVSSVGDGTRKEGGDRLQLLGFGFVEC